MGRLPAIGAAHTGPRGKTKMTRCMMSALLTLTVAGTTAVAVAAPAAAQGTIPPRETQIAAAVLPIPAEQRATARVLGYGADGKLATLREGKGMICLASDPKMERFHVACYHESLEPFMARGRALRAGGTKDPQVDSVRFREAKAGTLKLPNGPAALYSLTGGAFDSKTGTAPEARHLYVVYIPYASSATTGLPERPSGSQPWLMFPGTPKAHIMFTPGM